MFPGLRFPLTKVMVALMRFWGTGWASRVCLYNISLPLWLLLHPIAKWFEAVVGSVTPGLVSAALEQEAWDTGQQSSCLEPGILFSAEIESKAYS